MSKERLVKKKCAPALSPLLRIPHATYTSYRTCNEYKEVRTSQSIKLMAKGRNCSSFPKCQQLNWSHPKTTHYSKIICMSLRIKQSLNYEY